MFGTCKRGDVRCDCETCSKFSNFALMRSSLFFFYSLLNRTEFSFLIIAFCAIVVVSSFRSDARVLIIHMSYQQEC